MKKSIILAVAMLACVFAAQAARVSRETAANVALTYVSQQPGAAASLAVNTVENVGNGVYLVNFTPSGFALVSADDNSAPIFGFSTEGNLNPNNMPDNMACIVGEADRVINLKAANGVRNQTWSQLENGFVAVSRASTEPVEPLIKVTWNQSSPYNAYCPGTGNQKAIVGCVAVAMAQAMSVQRWPVKPQGHVTYVAAGYGQLSIDYDKEKEYDWDAILSGANRYDEAARLMYHTGMSVNMDYGPDGSGIPSSQVYRITNALKSYFGYGNDVTYKWRKDYQGDWAEFLLNELYAGRAIIYNAIDAKGGYGHSFNICGYNGALFYVNWGWGGYGNGYFSIDALADAQMNMNYDSSHVAVIGIGGSSSPLHSLALSDMTIEENSPVGTTVGAVLVNGELPTSEMNITVSGEYQSSGGYAQTPFEYKEGRLVTKSAIGSGPYVVRVVVSLKEDASVKLTQTFSITVEAPQPIQRKTSVAYDRATRTFKVHTKYNSTYSVKNAEGQVIVSGAVSTLPEFEFTRDQLTTGNNTVEITVGSETHSFTIVK